MTQVSDEIASQPECRRRAMELTPPGLPEPGERVAVLGCGTSLYIAQAYAALRESVATHLNQVFTAAVREPLTADQHLVDTRRYLGAGRAAMTAEVTRLLSVLKAPSRVAQC